MRRAYEESLIVLPHQEDLKYIEKYGRWQGHRLQLGEITASIQIMGAMANQIAEILPSPNSPGLEILSEAIGYIPVIGSLCSIALTLAGKMGYAYRKYKINRDIEILGALIESEIETLTEFRDEIERQGAATLEDILEYENRVNELIRAINLLSTIRNDEFWTSMMRLSLVLSIGLMVVFPPSIIAAPLVTFAIPYIQPAITGGVGILGRCLNAAGYGEDLSRDKRRDERNAEVSQNFHFKFEIHEEQLRDDKSIHLYRSILVARQKRDAEFLEAKKQCLLGRNQDLLTSRKITAVGSILTTIGALLCTTTFLMPLGVLFILLGLSINFYAAVQGYRVRKRGQLESAALDAKNENVIKKLSSQPLGQLGVFREENSYDCKIPTSRRMSYSF